MCQRYIYKIHSSRLRKERWRLILPIEEARRNDEVIALADSQVLRWIDELNEIYDADQKAVEIRTEINSIKKLQNSVKNKRQIRQLYQELDQIQFKPDYMCLIIDKEKDYYRACKGFTINGIKYKRLLGTNGGIKNSTIVFVSERLHDELERRIENGRDTSKQLVTAKLEAYRALTCSASIPVSFPEGLLVVDDAETEFYSDILYITNDGVDEPILEERKNEHIKMDASDGFGLMSPSLAERWSEELDLEYMMAGCNTRFSFEKGMVFTFDFVDFAKNIAHSYMVKDAWGNDVDIRDVELILTTSMVKLWDSYGSCDEYIRKSMSNKYTISITKVCPKELESERNLNYQFIQSYYLTDEDIDDLIAPTVNEIEDILNGDWRKTILYLKGVGMNARNAVKTFDDYAKAIMVDRRMLDDPFAQNSIYQLIKNRINEAKVGVLKVHGNYSIVSGDPYLLCQSIFGLKKTGLLKAGEIYNKYWVDRGAQKLACFRAPMTSMNNIRGVKPADRDDVLYWFRYMNTCTVFNGWDTAAAALNGMDFDGDLVFLSDNKILVDKMRNLPTLMCAQRRAEKRISNEDDFIRSNIDSFGNDIGQTTNWITSMFEVQSHFNIDSKEFKELEYRIQAGQLYQQDAIDKAKGIICKPMPRSWHDRHSANKIEDDCQREFYRSIVAAKKPYFMRYIYPSLMREYNTYVNNTNRNALREFQMTVKEMCATPYRELTDRQREFLKYYDYRMPVGTGDCVMNRICRKIESRFDGYIGRRNKEAKFDYEIMKSDAKYTTQQFYNIKRLYDDYNKRLKNYAVFACYERVDEYDSMTELSTMDSEFRKQCEIICPNEESLCNIILDLCYKKNSTRRFAWSMCGHTIINNLLKKNNNLISYLQLDDDGDIEFGGNKFRLEQTEVNTE